jgi:beta-lactamase class A
MIRRQPWHPHLRYGLLIVLLALTACGGTAPASIPTPTPLATAITAAETPTASAFVPERDPLPTAVPEPLVGLPDDLGASVETLIAAYDGWGITHTGIIIEDAATGQTFGINPDRSFPAASLYKPYLLWAVQEAIAAGRLRDDTLLTLTPANDDSVEDGYRLGDYGDTITVDRARYLMITASNNTAAWMLVEALGGWAAIERPLRASGFTATTTTAPGPTTTPREITRFFAGIDAGTLDTRLSAADYALMRDLFAEQAIEGYLAAGLPANVTFAHKTANLDGVTHDAGILTLADDRVFYVTVMTAGEFQAGQAFLRDLALLLSLSLGA